MTVRHWKRTQATRNDEGHICYGGKHSHLQMCIELAKIFQNVYGILFVAHFKVRFGVCKAS